MPKNILKFFSVIFIVFVSLFLFSKISNAKGYCKCLEETENIFITESKIECENICEQEKDGTVISFEEEEVVIQKNCQCIIDGEMKESSQNSENQCREYCEIENSGSFLKFEETPYDKKSSGETQPGQGQPQTTNQCACSCGNGTVQNVADNDACISFCIDKGEMRTCDKGLSGEKPPESITPGGEELGRAEIRNPIGIDKPVDLIKTIITYALGIVGALAVAAIIYSGFLYLTSAGNEKRTTAAKQALTAAIIGLILVFASYIIVQSVITAIGG